MIGANFVEFGGDPSAGVHRMYISDNSRHIFAFTSPADADGVARGVWGRCGA